MIVEKKKSKLFFGWDNFKWLIKEFLKMYSNQPSFFSKKRFESGVSFFVAQFGMIFFLLENHNTMTTSDLAIWSGIEFAVSGYILNQIQKEKKDDHDDVK